MLPTIAPIFQLKPAKLSGLLHNIDEHEAALPDFQRKWVWNAERIRDLLVSVAYRYPVGSILTIPVTDSIFQKRPFEGSYSESGGIIQWKSSPSLLVLDGQQRLTSLYQALFCKAGVVRGERIYHFYVDVQALMSDEDGIEVGTPCFKDALFFVEERKGQRLRYQRLQLLYEITTREQELAHGVLPLSLTFAPDELNGWKGDYLASLVPNNDLKQYRDLDAKWNALVGSWLNRIRHYELPEVELNKQMTLEAICYIFEKVNSAGVPLNVFDLCNAILWAQNFQLNKEWEKKVKELEPRVQMQPLDGVHYLMGINLLESLWLKRTATDGARIAVSCTREELLKLTGPVVKKWWDKLGSAYIEVARFMMAQGIISKDLLPYAPTIVPLAAVFSEILERKGAAHVTSTWPRLERWFWCCVFSRRYSSNIETNVASDFEQLLDWLDGGEAA